MRSSKEDDDDDDAHADDDVDDVDDDDDDRGMRPDCSAVSNMQEVQGAANCISRGMPATFQSCLAPSHVSWPTGPALAWLGLASFVSSANLADLDRGTTAILIVMQIAIIICQ